MAQGVEPVAVVSSTLTNSPEETKTATESGEASLTIKGQTEYGNVSYKKTKESMLLMSSIVAPYYRPAERQGIDLVCVVDESSSMAGDRIMLLRETVFFIIKNLESSDHFGIVGYGNKSREILSIIKMDKSGKEKALAAAETIAASGSTALCDGLCHAVQMIQNRKKTGNTIASVMLFTDGLANIGPSNAENIIKQVEATTRSSFSFSKYVPNWLGNIISFGRSKSNSVQVQGQVTQNTMIQQQQQQEQQQGIQNTMIQQQQQQQLEGIEEKNVKETNDDFGDLKFTINTFGFGEGHNENLLQALAEFGRGMYVFIKNTGLIAETFAECLGGLVSTVAQNIELRLEMLELPNNPSASINTCLSVGIHPTIIKEKKIYDIKVSDIQSEEHRDFLFDISLPELKCSSIPWTFGKLTCNFTNIINNKKETIVIDLKMDRTDNEEEGERETNIDLQHNRLIATQAMKHADEEANRGNLDHARELLTDAKKTIGTSKTNQDLYSVNLVKDLEKCNEGLRDTNAYSSYGSKVMKMNAKSHEIQRSAQSSGYESQQAYQNNSKKEMISKFM